MTDLRAAALAVLRLNDAHRDAENGQGHPGEPHDTALGDPLECAHSEVGDCAACGGALYGIEDEQNRAWGDLRVALGEEPKPWER